MRFTEKQWRELFKRYSEFFRFDFLEHNTDMISIHVDRGSVNFKGYHTMLDDTEGWESANVLNGKHPFASTDDTQYAYFTEGRALGAWIPDDVMIGKSMPTKKGTLRFEMKFPIDFVFIDDIINMTLTVTDAQITSVTTEGEFANA